MSFDSSNASSSTSQQALYHSDRSPSIPGTPHSDVASTAVDAHSPRISLSEPVSEAGKKKRSRPTGGSSSTNSDQLHPVKRLRSEHQSSAASSSSSSSTAKGKSIAMKKSTSNESSDEFVQGNLEEPTPPQNPKKHPWFDYEYTQEDTECEHRFIPCALSKVLIVCLLW